MTANETVHRVGARHFDMRVAGLSSVGFAADAQFPAPVGDFIR
jgi:hypothetical protein